MSADEIVPVDRSPAGWLLYAIAAVLACGAAGLLLDQRLDTHLLPYRWGPDKDTMLQGLRGEKLAEAYSQLRITGRQGGAIALGCVAGALALALCLADAVMLRRPASFILSPLGAVIAAAAGAGGGFLAMRLHQRLENASSESLTMTEAIMVQVAAWA